MTPAEERLVAEINRGSMTEALELLGLTPGSVVFDDQWIPTELIRPVVTITPGGLVTLHGLEVLDDDRGRWFLPMARVQRVELAKDPNTTTPGGTE